MVCLQADTENDIDFEELVGIYTGWVGRDYKYAIFRDSDLGDMETAIAFEPMEKEVGDEYMGHFKLA